jgi:hypothetical protein
MSRDFDGVDDFILCGSNPIINNLFAIPGGTAMAWINFDSIGENGFGRIFDKDNGGFGWLLHLSSGVLRFGHAFEGAGNVDGTWNTPLAISNSGKWIHTAVTYLNALSTNDPILYINAVSGTVTENTTPATDPTLDNLQAMRIGNRSAADRTFDGRISYAELHDVILTPDEIKESMMLPGSVQRGLVFFQPLNGGAIEPDLSGRLNNGTVTGAVMGSNNAPVNGVGLTKKPELSHVF